MDIFQILTGLAGNQKVLKQLNQLIEAEWEKSRRLFSSGFPCLMNEYKKNSRIFLKL